MKKSVLTASIALLLIIFRMMSSNAGGQSVGEKSTAVTPNGHGTPSPIYGVTIPEGYRQWELVAPSHEAEKFNELRAILGNPKAIKAYRDGTLPFPDGTILAKLAWKQVPLDKINGAFVSGHATTVQMMVKDSKKYGATGGWGFGRFVNGAPANEAEHETCFACHAAHAEEHDLVFTHYAP